MRRVIVGTVITGSNPMIINYFLLLTTLLLFAGLALDTGILEWKSMHTQQAADAAAQEAMYQFARNDSSWASAGQAAATLNGFTNGVNGATVSITNPPTSGLWLGDTSAVQATVSQTAYNLFMGFVGGGKSTVASNAVAKVLYTCVWIMNQSGSTSNGSLWLLSSNMHTACGVYVNTSSGYSLGVDGFSNLLLSGNNRIRVVGPASSGAISTGTINTPPKYGAAAKNDPLAYITAPVFSSCNHTLLSYSNTTQTISPGTYCGGITISHTTLYLNPGLYIITGGISASYSYIYGQGGVTLYFTKGGGYSYGTVSIAASSSCSAGCSGLYLKAPTIALNGSIPGIVIFGDRGWITHNSQGVQITFSQVITDGIWYLPNTGLYLWLVEFGYYAYNGLVIDNLYQFGDNSYVNANYANLGGVSPLHYEDGLLVQ